MVVDPSELAKPLLHRANVVAQQQNLGRGTVAKDMSADLPSTNSLPGIQTIAIKGFV
jgi:hypothetical protein